MATPYEKQTLALLERIAHAAEVSIGRPREVAKEKAIVEADAAALAQEQKAEADAKAAVEAEAKAEKEKAAKAAQAEIDAAQAKLKTLQSGAPATP